MDEKIDKMNTISTKLSTDQLICKSPQESPTHSIQSLEQKDDTSLLCLGLLQFIFGFLMLVFGGLVLHYDASLAQLGGGIWAGCLAMATGIMGILTSAREWCPLKSALQKITHTIFLALSLISLAIAQLVMALAATGVGRDINNSEYDIEESQIDTTQISTGKISIDLPLNYLSILTNLGLLLAAFGEFIVAAIASYKSSRVLCPCFRKNEEILQDSNVYNGKDALVTSWLGKHSPPPHIYVVAPGPGSNLSKSGRVTPVFAVTPHQIMGYPLIPAPLGTIPSPIIPPSPTTLMRKKKKYVHAGRIPTPKKPKSRTRTKEKTVTEQDVVRTYTGLDKTIAEEFIDICDSRNVSLCSDSSCTSSCQRSCNGCINNPSCDGTSTEYLVSHKH